MLEGGGGCFVLPVGDMYNNPSAEKWNLEILSFLDKFQKTHSPNYFTVREHLKFQYWGVSFTNVLELIFNIVSPAKFFFEKIGIF